MPQVSSYCAPDGVRCTVFLHLHGFGHSILKYFLPFSTRQPLRSASLRRASSSLTGVFWPAHRSPACLESSWRSLADASGLLRSLPPCAACARACGVGYGRWAHSSERRLIGETLGSAVAHGSASVRAPPPASAGFAAGPAGERGNTCLATAAAPPITMEPPGAPLGRRAAAGEIGRGLAEHDPSVNPVPQIANQADKKLLNCKNAVSEARHAPYVHDQHHPDRGVRHSCWRCAMTGRIGSSGGQPRARWSVSRWSPRSRRTSMPMRWSGRMVRLAGWLARPRKWSSPATTRSAAYNCWSTSPSSSPNCATRPGSGRTRR